MFTYGYSKTFAPRPRGRGGAAPDSIGILTRIPCQGREKMRRLHGDRKILPSHLVKSILPPALNHLADIFHIFFSHVHVQGKHNIIFFYGIHEGEIIPSSAQHGVSVIPVMNLT